MRAILCCDKNGGIGKNGSMPWPKDDKDLARFKELTLNQTVVMGRGTWESTSMPHPLPNRQNIVVSTQELSLPDNVIRLDNVNYETLVTDLKVDWCIGGASLFYSIFYLIDEIHLTRLRKDYNCDTKIHLDHIEENFDLVSDLLCVEHNYQIWKRKP